MFLVILRLTTCFEFEHIFTDFMKCDQFCVVFLGSRRSMTQYDYEYWPLAPYFKKSSPPRDVINTVLIEGGDFLQQAKKSGQQYTHVSQINTLTPGVILFPLWLRFILGLDFLLPLSEKAWLRNYDKRGGEENFQPLGLRTIASPPTAAYHCFVCTLTCGRG